MVRTVTILLASATVAGQILILGGILLYIARNLKLRGASNMFSLIKRYILPFTFLVSLTATLGSLFFSEIARYTPCTLCWYQRILMYPQVFILGHDIVRKRKTGFVYSLILSAVGLPIALYQYWLQLFPSPSLFCASGAVDCAQKVSFSFGYISIPLMAATAFTLILLAFSFARKSKKP